MEGNILIVDDNKSVLSSMRLYLKHKVERVITCSNPNQIPSLLETGDIDVVLLDMNFSSGINTGNEGLFWLREILKIDPSMVVILITAYGDVSLAVNAMKEGATDFVLKPWDNHKLLATLKNGVNLRRTKREVKTLKSQKKELQKSLNKGFEHFLGDSEPMEQVQRTIRKVASTDANVLILGENGTGKELVAREIHRLSTRAGKIFMGVDMGAISESLFESELFGHVKGAFTDAKEDRIGRFKSANGGSLFLDEIGNLSESMQSKLLCVLQNREVTPLGANRPVDVDARLICATNKDLNAMVDQGIFREDLIYRINTIQIQLPPLRDRGDDVILLAKHFLRVYAKRYNRSSLTMSGKTIELLKQYRWPGNVRELCHAMERAVILSENNVLEPYDFPFPSSVDSHSLAQEPMSLEQAEKILILGAMKRHKGNVSNVAKELNIGRQTLYRKMQKYEV